MPTAATPAPLALGFDADDTLWHNEGLFSAAHAKFHALLAAHHDAATVDRALYATELRNLPLYGYGAKGFTLSAIETAIELTAGRVSSAELRELIALGRESALPLGAPAQPEPALFLLSPCAAEG